MQADRTRKDILVTARPEGPEFRDAPSTLIGSRPAPTRRKPALTQTCTRKTDAGLQLAKVFVVEDSATMIELLRELLENVGGLEVIGFSSTEAEAKLWLDENPGRWDIAVFDLILEQ